ncbi:MAG: response regulator [Candidatus Omnitrophica bacterium]|nr:response regulator [Candidatus Omnitrophota bacterium]
MGAKKILVVEDDSASQYLMELVIKEMGFAYTAALVGEKAVELMRTEKFDLILMDLRLPRMSGYEATKIIREEIDKDIPIFAVTAHTAQAVSLKCYDLGMNEFIPKPIDVDKLKELMFKYLEMRRTSS